MLLQDELTTLARARGGVDYFGMADLTIARDFIRNQAGGLLPQLSMAVSIGIVLPDTVVNMLSHRDQNAVRVSYRTHAYDIVNRRLDLVASEIGSILQRRGYQAFPVAASERVDDKRICAIFSHKLAANLSGLGWIGKSCLLVTPDNGPRVRWATVLTNAPLEPTGEPMQDRCATCIECVEICPVQAFSGKHFDPNESREVRYRADKCDAYFRAMETKGELKVCGMCLYVCPFGREKAAGAQPGTGAYPSNCAG
jgi:epoxyqueuosine reductase QueG